MVIANGTGASKLPAATAGRAQPAYDYAEFNLETEDFYLVVGTAQVFLKWYRPGSFPGRRCGRRAHRKAA